MYLLYYFVTLVDEGTYTKAAETLHISQPSLSIAIKKLEQLSGLELINREHRKLTLTKEGRLIYYEAKNLVEHYRYVQNEIERLKVAGAFELSISVIESTKYWFPQVIKRFQDVNDQVKIKIHDILGISEVIHALNHYEIDLAITNQYINDDRMIVTPLYQEELIALIPKIHPLIQEDTISIKQLNKQPFIIGKEGLQTRADVLNTFKNHRVKPDIVIEMEGFEIACSLVKENIGITILPKQYALAEQFAPEQIKSFSDATITRTVYITYMKSRYLSPIVARFIDFIKNNFEH